MTNLNPIKVNAETDQLISHAAHFLGRTKKDIVDEAVRDYIAKNRETLNDRVREALSQLDGSRASVVTMLTGFNKDELDDLGGVPEK
jgi:hypothetical protein